ncbi:serine/threonine-protein kinase Nek10-like [Saccoglossus kowalevskii]|uniref:Serine/threonine-protein kinase Nek10-like n=1 Tax=Saccoglossus kowalevskii TaxID=10224 RepID=A0ABM0M1T9_SACKO|nr:PREDICTED: serine/threonine-protein kinase Nek10-like [Saccoglossus kowalevskii]
MDCDTRLAVDEECQQLSKLLDLLDNPATEQQLPSSEVDPSNNNEILNKSVQNLSIDAVHYETAESQALEKLSLKYQSERHFSSHQQKSYFNLIFRALVEKRLCCIDWADKAPPEIILRVLICLRMLMRDASYQKLFFKLGGIKVLAERLQTVTERYLHYGEQAFILDILKEMTNIFQKLSAVVSQRDWLVACGAHKPLVLLLSSNDVIVLHCTLYALISLAESPAPRALIGELNCIETLLRILQDYDILSKKLAASLLRILCADSQVREQVKIYDGVPILLSVLHCDNLKLLWNCIWCIVQLSEDADISSDIKTMGGVPLILSILHDRKFVSDHSSGPSGLPKSADRAGRKHPLAVPVDNTGEDEPLEHVLSLQSACCAALTELVLNDANAQQLVQNNGVYVIGMLIFLQKNTRTQDASAVNTLQKNAFRALRFLFSMERNRQLFKRLFPADLFEKFIDVGHYVRDIKKYEPLLNMINSMSNEELSVIKECFQDTNQNKEPTHHINNYAVYEHLGTGAFGSVYKVKKKMSGQFLAMKEISLLNPAIGKTAKERDVSVGRIVSELPIIKEGLKHPNVVRYYKTFNECDKLFIVMEFIEGAPLTEHFNSLKEKNENFTEDRIWNIFIQIVLALRYLHKEKRIVHRDLSPNNIMLGENDKVTITDFGLARVKQQDCSKMTSVVGTILYSCPEIVQSIPYGEKADVWSIGCILYQMSALAPPFYSSNMLSLATKIVEAKYDPLPIEKYSNRIPETIKRCLTPDPDDRPDIVQVAGAISDILLIYMDKLRLNQISMEKKLDRERKRTQRHFNEATHNMQNYHRLFLASQERYDKLLASSSGGAASIRSDSDMSDNVFDGCEHESNAELKTINKHRLIENCHAVPITLEPEKDVFSGAEEDDTGYKTDGGTSSLENSGNSTSLGISFDSHRITPRPPSGKGSLTLDIPTVNHSKSACSSGSPSPNEVSSATPPVSSERTGLLRSQSSSLVEMALRRGGQSSQLRNRPPSATATLTISPRKVRQINDPIMQMLNQLHKIIFVTQLPPTLAQNPKRRVIERFKRALFAQQSSSSNLKSELKKLMIGSREVIDLNFGVGETTYLLKHGKFDDEETGMDASDLDVGITYEHMLSIIESVLRESGYYDMSPSARYEKTPRTRFYLD